MGAINRAKRRFFLRPRYVMRHFGDVAQLVASKPAIVTHLLWRMLVGRPVIDVRAASSSQAGHGA